MVTGNPNPRSATRVELAALIDEAFNIAELRELCFQLEVDYGRLPGEEKGRKIIELIMYMERRDQVDALLQKCAELRPKKTWPHQLLPPEKDPINPPDSASTAQEGISQSVSASDNARIGNVTQQTNVGWFSRLWRRDAT